MPASVITCVNNFQNMFHWSSQLCEPLFKVSLDHGPCSTHAAKAYASIINKHPEGIVQS